MSSVAIGGSGCGGSTGSRPVAAIFLMRNSDSAAPSSVPSSNQWRSIDFFAAGPRSLQDVRARIILPREDRQRVWHGWTDELGDPRVEWPDLRLEVGGICLAHPVGQDVGLGSIPEIVDYFLKGVRLPGRRLGFALDQSQAHSHSAQVLPPTLSASSSAPFLRAGRSPARRTAPQ